jgi:hypothetical protein
MLLTPSTIGAPLAGICLWTLFWASLHKIEEIPGVRDALSSNRCLERIEQHTGLTLLLTEATNYLVHGVSSPVGVGFAMGGTIANLLVVYGYIPSRSLVAVITAKQVDYQVAARAGSKITAPKPLNDRCGHPTGDLVLMGFTECLTNAIRGSDLAVQIGGGEFVVLLLE